MLLSHHSQILKSESSDSGVFRFIPTVSHLDGASWYIGFNAITLDAGEPLHDIFVLESSLVYNSTRIFSQFGSAEPLHIVAVKSSPKDITPPAPEPPAPPPKPVYRQIAYKQLESNRLFKITSIRSPVELRLRPLQDMFVIPKDCVIHLHISVYKTV